jgi:hypothetical protein
MSAYNSFNKSVIWLMESSDFNSAWVLAYMLIWTKFKRDDPNGWASIWAKTLTYLVALAMANNPKMNKRVVDLILRI